MIQNTSSSNISENTRQTIVYEYCLLRYVADIEREEFLNIGLMMMCKRFKWMRNEIFIDEDRIRNCFPKANLTLLAEQAQLFERKDVPSADVAIEERYRWMAAVKSAIIQTSASHPGIFSIDTSLSANEIKSILNAKFSDLFHRLVTQ